MEPKNRSLLENLSEKLTIDMIFVSLLYFSLRYKLHLFPIIFGSTSLFELAMIFFFFGLFLYLVLLYAVVILVPTRELALQTSQVCKELGKHLKIQVMVTTGGTSLKDDIMRLYQPVHLLVGTPGRILDLAKKGVCILKDCSMLVMDEVNA